MDVIFQMDAFNNPLFSKTTKRHNFVKYIVCGGKWGMKEYLIEFNWKLMAIMIKKNINNTINKLN